MRGFTLIELMVVLAILGGAAVILLPVAAFRPSSVAGAERQVTDLLRSARATAIRSGRPVDVAVEPETRRVGYPGRVVALPGDVGLQLLAGPLRLRFYPDGSATAARLGVARGTDRRTVTIDWLTGAVRRV